MYKKREVEQFNIFDKFYGLTPREQKFLEKSWAYQFGNDIFPLIDQDKFACLYSSNYSRPSAPINVLAGALIIKEITGMSDDELLETLLFDVRYQYALHTTSFEEQPLSDKSLQRFRNRLLTYKITTGKDILHEMMDDITGELSKLMKINTSLKRMDSFMIESNIKTLSRMELIYVTVANFVKYLDKNDSEVIDELKHYLNKDDQNRFIYHSNVSKEEKIKLLLSDVLITVNNYSTGEYDEVSEYQLLVRVINEQTKKEGNEYVLKSSEDEMDATIIQSPYDTDATYRNKAGKKHRGYVANIVESGESGNTLITDYDIQKNTYSDQKFMGDYIESKENIEVHETVVVDGAYSSSELIKKQKKRILK